MTTSLEGWPTKVKEAPSPREVTLAPLDTNPVFQSLGESNCVCQSRPKEQIFNHFKSIFIVKNHI